MSGLTHWVDMGGYAAFVWSAYGVTAAILGGMAWLSWWRYRASQRALDRMQGGSRQRP